MKWEEINLPNLKTSYMATVISMMLSHRSMEKIESSEIDPRKYVRMIFDKDIKAIQWRKDSLFNKWMMEQLTCMAKTKKKKEFWPKSHTKIKF